MFSASLSLCFLGSFDPVLAVTLPHSLDGSGVCAVWRHFSGAGSGILQLPCKWEWCVSQAIACFIRGPIVSLELHIDTVTHSSITKAFVLLSTS